MATNAIVAVILALESGPGHSDHGRAIGPLQIHRAVVVDVNRYYGTAYRHTQMTNLAAASAVCRLYLQHWAPGASVETQLRVWNGGPRGPHKRTTRAYVERARRMKLI